MSREKLIEILKLCQEDEDTENAHLDADNALCEFLINLGYEQVVEEYKKVSKWYA